MESVIEGRPHVVIVGCGFGGLAATRALADVDVDITLIDRENHHTFQPLLYQVASAGLNPSDIAQPIRHIVRKQNNVRVRLAEVTAIDLDARAVLTADVAFPYDHLVLAAGATHSYFGNDSWAEFAPGLKSIDDALDIRRRILLAFEQAENTADVAERERLMTFVIVGAGPTGVELAGAVKEIATKALSADFRSIDTTKSRVVLVEAGPRVLGAFTEKLSASAERQLAKLGVDVQLSTPVIAIDEHGVTTEAGIIPAATVLWGAGVAASPLGRAVTGRRRSGGPCASEGRPQYRRPPRGVRYRRPRCGPVGRQGGARRGSCCNTGRPARRPLHRSRTWRVTAGRCSGTRTRARWPRSVGRRRLRTSARSSSSGATSPGSCGGLYTS